MSAKRSFWATIGKILWTIISFVFRILAKLGSRWARKKLDRHDKAEKQKSRGAVGRVLHRKSGH